MQLFRKLGIRPEQREQCATEEQEEEAIAEAVEYEATRTCFTTRPASLRDSACVTSPKR